MVDLVKSFDDVKTHLIHFLVLFREVVSKLIRLSSQLGGENVKVPFGEVEINALLLKVLHLFFRSSQVFE
jgi:hypothetical protein